MMCTIGINLPTFLEVSSTRFGGEFQGQEYYMCEQNSNLHEGDWEHATLFTCTADLWKLLAEQPSPQSASPNASSVVRQMQLSQSTWAPLLDCTQQGQCPTEMDPQVRATIAHDRVNGQ